jgi:hypothetical protein
MFMKTLAILLIVLAGLCTLVGIQLVFIARTYKEDDIPAFAGHLVGTFLDPMVLLIVGLKLLNKVNGK